MEFKPSRRAAAMRSFKVMDVVHKANLLERAGREIYHLEIGQPQSAAPQPAIRVAQQQLTVHHHTLQLVGLVARRLHLLQLALGGPLVLPLVALLPDDLV